MPNMLTLSRIGIIPLLILLFYLDRPLASWGALALFAIAGITDYFDGYLARHRKQVSAFGRFLDPIADKLLVAAVLLMLVATHRVEGLVVLPALVILCREILVSGLREYLAEIKVSVPIRLVGEAPGVKRDGGLLHQLLRDLEVECLPGSIPGEVPVDLSSLEMGDVIHVGSLQLGEAIRVLTHSEEPVVTVARPEVEEVAVPEEEEVAAAAEEVAGAPAEEPGAAEPPSEEKA